MPSTTYLVMLTGTLTSDLTDGFLEYDEHGKLLGMRPYFEEDEEDEEYGVGDWDDQTLANLQFSQGGTPYLPSTQSPRGKSGASTPVRQRNKVSTTPTTTSPFNPRDLPRPYPATPTRRSPFNPRDLPRPNPVSPTHPSRSNPRDLQPYPKSTRYYVESPPIQPPAQAATSSAAQASPARTTTAGGRFPAYVVLQGEHPGVHRDW